MYLQSRTLPESSSVSSSVRSERHVDEILRIGGIKRERELHWLIDLPVKAPVLVVVVVLNAEPVAPPHIEGLAEQTELSTRWDVKIPPTPSSSAIGVIVWVVGCLYGCRTSLSKVKCVFTFQSLNIIPWSDFASSSFW